MEETGTGWPRDELGDSYVLPEPGPLPAVPAPRTAAPDRGFVLDALAGADAPLTLGDLGRRLQDESLLTRLRLNSVLRQLRSEGLLTWAVRPRDGSAMDLAWQLA